MESNRVAVLIGNSEYTAGYKCLHAAASDVEKMSDVLVAQWSFAAQVNCNVDSHCATRVISDCRKMLARLGQDGLLLFHYSGHALEDAGDFLLQLVDARPGIQDHHAEISLRKLIGSLVACTQEAKGPTTNRIGPLIVLILDCCRTLQHSGTPFSFEKCPAPARVLVMFACGRGERARESADLNHGYFTWALLEVLRNSQNSRNIRWPDIFQKVASNVRKRSLDFQNPWIGSTMNMVFPDLGVENIWWMHPADCRGLMVESVQKAYEHVSDIARNGRLSYELTFEMFMQISGMRSVPGRKKRLVDAAWMTMRIQGTLSHYYVGEFQTQLDALNTFIGPEGIGPWEDDHQPYYLPVLALASARSLYALNNMAMQARLRDPVLALHYLQDGFDCFASIWKRVHLFSIDPLILAQLYAAVSIWSQSVVACDHADSFSSDEKRMCHLSCCSLQPRHRMLLQAKHFMELAIDRSAVCGHEEGIRTRIIASCEIAAQAAVSLEELKEAELRLANLQNAQALTQLSDLKIDLALVRVHIAMHRMYDCPEHQICCLDRAASRVARLQQRSVLSNLKERLQVEELMAEIERCRSDLKGLTICPLMHNSRTRILSDASTYAESDETDRDRIHSDASATSE